MGGRLENFGFLTLARWRSARSERLRWRAWTYAAPLAHDRCMGYRGSLLTTPGWKAHNIIPEVFLIMSRDEWIDKELSSELPVIRGRGEGQRIEYMAQFVTAAYRPVGPRGQADGARSA